jgi:hypothetical protein
MMTGLISTLAEFFSETDDSQTIKILKVIRDLPKLSFEYSLADEIHGLLLDLVPCSNYLVKISSHSKNFVKELAIFGQRLDRKTAIYDSH